jgi:hypothetical protein
VLTDGGLLAKELAEADDFVRAISEFVDIIVAYGPRAAALEADNG